MPLKEIAAILGKSVRTIQREVSRGKVTLQNSDLTYRTEYCADTAQMKYETFKSNKGRNYKIADDYELVEYLEKKIGKENYSPDAAIGRAKIEEVKFKTSICTKTVYNYLDAGFFLNISNKDLPVKKGGSKRQYKKRTVALNNLKGTSIDERPKKVEDREEYGHWEMDCVVGGTGKGKNVLLTLTERKTREEIILKMKSKSQNCVVKCLDKLERKLGAVGFRNTYKSITVDNGSEFLDFQGMESSKINKKIERTKVYYAHPYSSWERGTNENMNKMIRRFIPKGASIDDVPESMIRIIENWLNNYPRKILGYKTPNEVRDELLQGL